MKMKHVLHIHVATMHISTTHFVAADCLAPFFTLSAFVSSLVDVEGSVVAACGGLLPDLRILSSRILTSFSESCMQ